jgi:Glycosyltransferase WbsX
MRDGSNETNSGDMKDLRASLHRAKSARFAVTTSFALLVVASTMMQIVSFAAMRPSVDCPRQATSLTEVPTVGTNGIYALNKEKDLTVVLTDNSNADDAMNDSYPNVANNSYPGVKRHPNGTLYMAYYFAPYHLLPENNRNGKLYTDWNFIDVPHRSISPVTKYDLANESSLAWQDDLAHKHNVGVFIFYQYWLDNSMVMNLPLDMFIQRKRKTKFMLCWANEGGFLGNPRYDKPEQHAYQLLRFFRNENYLTDADGRKPFMFYIVEGVTKSYVDRFESFLARYDVHVKISFTYMDYRNKYTLPAWNSFGVEFAVHTNSYYGEYKVRQNNFDTYWQGALVSWDNRPRLASGRTKHRLKRGILDKAHGRGRPRSVQATIGYHSCQHGTQQPRSSGHLVCLE